MKKRNKVIVYVIFTLCILNFKLIKAQGICYDTLKAEYSINRITNSFLNNHCSYQKAYKIVVKRMCELNANIDTSLNYPSVVCEYADIYYDTSDIDTIFNKISSFLAQKKVVTIELDFATVLLERGVIFCLDKNKQYIRLLTIDACLEKKKFNRVLHTLKRSKMFNKVCLVRCDGLDFKEFLNNN